MTSTGKSTGPSGTAQHIRQKWYASRPCVAPLANNALGVSAPSTARCPSDAKRGSGSSSARCTSWGISSPAVPWGSNATTL
eukprot:CAMPEP_0179223204 /NCGR_PEP_ID=MMETSP0797-20121207/7108_1 /TAXON_ID=47934 /ORGANISM="Dinophysis acuminata, Strain DAEP01" /LENGTH=80 /DNA_ID=CAMNT_0020930055 /DNA_START=393 /DNA_END=635 /DNA_ORIENTATION=-